MFALLFWAITVTADLAFGHAQVVRLEQDRPEMTAVIQKEDALRNFLVWNFAGLDTGDRVGWDGNEPEGAPSVYLAQGKPPRDFIRITKDLNYSPEEKCVLAVFELENARSGRRATTLTRMAYSGQIGREDFARSLVHMEFLTCRRTLAFFRQNPLPHQSENYWINVFLEFPTDFSEYMDSLTAHPDRSHLEFFRQYYDRITVPVGQPAN